LRAWLDAVGAPYTPHYLVNMIEVQGDAALAEQLRLRPEVDRLARNPAIQQKHSTPGQSRWLRLPLAEAQATAALPYGLSYTHADQVWELGVRGEGVVVGSQDTGVQWDHPALVGAYRGWDSSTLTATHAYNWFDAFGRDPLQDAGCDIDPQIPCDDQGHGTHTVGTVVGDATGDGGTVLGMAPAAEWIGCRNMRGGVGTPASYTACFEWFLAPYPQGGDPFQDGKPELAPDIINNSWGCPPYEGCDANSLLQVTDLVRTAGIFIAASAGNDGWQGCSSITDPIAIYDSAFTTGAHDAQGTVANFSSRGPVTVDGSGRLKPDITAPGVGTYSTYPHNTYTSLSGTSMASPHVAGAVALLWSAVPALAGEIERTEEILLNSAAPVTASGCGPGYEAVAPNNVYGHGRLDVLAAVDSVLVPVTLTITLMTSSSLPVDGESVQLVNNRTQQVYSGVSDSQGQVIWNAAEQPLLAGSYTVRTQGCTGYMEVGSVELAPDDRASETIVIDAFTCQYLPFIRQQ
jgi:subtilisin family serine protease